MTKKISRAKQIEKKEASRAKLDAEIRQLKAEDKKEEQAKNLRQKILIGGAILRKTDNNDDEKSRMLKMMDTYLIKDNERELFGLQKLNNSETGGD